jgi:phenylacetic acid degradation operon negative regulatory protein
MAAPADPVTKTANPRPPRSVLLAGFDAGQTHTTCRLAGDDGVLLAEAEGPGVVHLAAPGGPQRFMAALRESLAAARVRLPEAWLPVPLAAAAVGASGIEAGSPVQTQGLTLAAAALGLPSDRLVVTGDDRTALRGAFPEGPGIVVISGTGTIAVGSDGQGRHHRCAGWGWLLDGAGSTMDIGRDALALSLRMADGRDPDGPLRRGIWQALGLDPQDPGAPQRIKALVVDPAFGAAGFARLAPELNRLAEGGDRPAIAILERNAEALVAMVAAVAAALDLREPPVAALGGGLIHLAGLRDRFERGLRRRRGILVATRGDACHGALQLAAALLQPDPDVGAAEAVAF